MVQCGDGTLYTGITTNLEQRIVKHNRKQGAKYTAIRLPVTLVWHEVYADRSTASKREFELKQLTRQQKLSLLREP